MPYAVRIAADWAWRVAIIIGALGLIIWLLSQISLLLIPLMISALLAGLLGPVVGGLRRIGIPNGLATGITMLGFLGLIVAALSVVGQRLAVGLTSLWSQALTGIAQIQHWLAVGPLKISNEDLDTFIDDALSQLRNNSSGLVSGALSWGTTVGHLLTGVLLVLFSLIFFLLDGRRIGMFLVKLLPRRARPAAEGAGRKGWISMVSYVRVQLFVAFIDAVGIGVGAFILGVPLAMPLGVLVFIGSFIPILGALVTGAVAVLLALVANGWLNALIMLAIVLLVQQAESHILQPLVMGKAVSLHPLAVVMTVTAGTMIAGIAGALFAVPLMAVLNSVIRYIAARGWDDDPSLIHADPKPQLAPSAPVAPADLDGEILPET